MSITCSVFIAMSLDGFIARQDGDISWLIPREFLTNEDFGYITFIDTVDAIVMGRKSFEKVCTFDDWPYGDIPVMVLSSHELYIPLDLKKTVTSYSSSLEHLIEELTTAGRKHLYIDGGITIQRFLTANLIDNMTITIIPILLGEGISLFGFLPKEIHLEMKNIRTYPSGHVQILYKIPKS